jgi:hypothetical protein
VLTFTSVPPGIVAGMTVYTANYGVVLGTTTTPITSTTVPLTANVPQQVNAGDLVHFQIAAGWDNSVYSIIQMCCADRVNANTFYACNDGSSGGSTEGIYRSTNSGVSWSKVASGISGNHAQIQFRSVPNNAGHLFISTGLAYNDVTIPFYFTSNGGPNIAPVTGVTWVGAFGFGKPTATYPVIYVFGSVVSGGSPTYGLWKCQNFDTAQTWTLVATLPINSLDLVTAVEGDANTAGLVYVAFGGSGCARIVG